MQASIDMGTVYSGIQKMIRGANFHSYIINYRYGRYSKGLSESMHKMFEKQRPRANKAVIEEYTKHGFLPCEDGNLNVDISFDGTYLTRFHHSNIGAGFIIDAYTGCVLDYEIVPC